MSWLSNLGNTVECWFGHKSQPKTNVAPDPEAPIKSLMSHAPKVGGQIGENARMKQQLLDGSFKKGGHVKKTGIYKLHKGEEVVPAKKKEMAGKMKKRKGLESYLDDFIKHGKERHDENMWKYARENRMSDKRMF